MTKPDIGPAVPGFVTVDVVVTIRARVTVPTVLNDAQLSQSVLSQVAILAPFASNVREMSVGRTGVVGIVGGGGQG